MKENTNKKPEVILIISDISSSNKSADIPEQFKDLFTKSKIDSVICLGNVGSKENYDFFNGLSKSFHCIRGDFEENMSFNYGIQSSLPENKVIKVDDFKIGITHGHNIVPWGDINSLSIYQKVIDCDILVYGFTGKASFHTFEGKHYLNPGSLSGAYSPIIPDPTPSFMVLVIDGDVGIAYKYELNKKIEISKIEFKKLPTETYVEIEEEH